MGPGPESKEELHAINLGAAASSQHLREDLQDQAARHGVGLRALVGRILAYAIKNKAEFRDPLTSPRSPGGRYIGASVPKEVHLELEKWATARQTSRSTLYRYILESALEGEKMKIILRNWGD